MTLHIGGQDGFFGSTVWSETDLLRPGSFSSGEPVGPHMLATMQLSPQKYLASMLYGGVFDRHPTLRIGVIELGAMWVGPFVDLLEDRFQLSRRLRDSLQRRPAEVFVDQIRVTPFFWEPTAMRRRGACSVVRAGVASSEYAARAAPASTDGLPEGRSWLFDNEQRCHPHLAERRPVVAS